jgi:histidyl-tRNA synthetase
MGWAAGIERILLAAEQRPQPEPVVDLYVAYDDPERRREAFVVAGEARRAGMAAQLELGGRSLKGQLRQAARLEARYVAILDGEGMRLRDMETHEQQDVESAAALVARVIKGRHPG